MERQRVLAALVTALSASVGAPAQSNLCIQSPASVADALGEPSENRPDLSSTRARAVAQFLDPPRIETSRMKVSGRGVAELVAPNVDLPSRAANRRVDVWILPR